MTGLDFLKRLEAALEELSDGQRQEVMTYFQEYLAEAENDSAAVLELGDPEAVAKELLEQFQEKGILEEKTIIQSLSEVATLVVSVNDLDVVIKQANVSDVVVEASEEVQKLLQLSRDNGRVTISEMKHYPDLKRGLIFRLFSLSIGLGSGIVIKVPRDLVFDAVDVSSLNGDVEVLGLNAKEVNFNLLNGDVEISRSQSDTFTLELQNGDGDLSDLKVGRLTTDLQNGDLSLRNLVSDEKLDCHLQNGDLFNTKSLLNKGNIHLLNGDLAVLESKFADLSIEIQCGDVSVKLTDGQENDIDIKAEANSGDFTILGHKGEDDTYHHVNDRASNHLVIANCLGDISVF